MCEALLKQYSTEYLHKYQTISLIVISLIWIEEF